VGSVIADPFLTLAQVLAVSFMVFLGARLLVPASARERGGADPTYESALRVVCYGLTPAILAALPLFGGPIAYLYKIAVTVIAAREVYRVSNGRATLVALFPHVLLTGFLALVLVALLVAAIKFFTMSF
jgi:hypothetical protein